MKQELKNVIEPLRKQLKNIPSACGVYMMLDKKNEVIYIGKANNLKERVRSYLNVKSWESRPKLNFMIPKVKVINTILAKSEKEALILEANLVNKYQPRYNVTLKDDKKFPWLMITYDEEYPRVVPIRDVGRFRKKYPKTKNKFFGPYTDSGAMWEMYKILKEGFQLRLRRKPLFKDRPCMNYHIGLCSGPCQELISKTAYYEIVKQVDDFLMGKYDVVLKNMRLDMKNASDKLEYEKAKKIRDTIKSIEKVLEKQIVVSDNSRLSEDVFAASFDNKSKTMILELMLVREGKIIAVESFPVKLPVYTSFKDALVDGIKQYYSRIDDKNIPDEVIVQYKLKEKENIEEWLTSRHGKKVKILQPQKGKKYELVKMAVNNARHTLQRILISHVSDSEEIAEKSLKELQRSLKLKKYPDHIECFDISHFGGTGSVASMVCFTNGKSDKGKYRKYKLKSTVDKIDDYESMREVITRRYKNSQSLPDLIIIDGGKGQLSAAKEALKEQGINISLDIKTQDSKHSAQSSKMVDLISIAKKQEEIFKPGTNKSILLPQDSPALHLVQRIRDEAHRFAITYQRDTRFKQTFESSLDNIPGLGKARVKRLMNYFGSLKNIQASDLETFARTLGQDEDKVANLWNEIKSL